MSQEEEYPVGRCVTRRRVSITVLCHKKESIHYGAVSQEGEFPLWRCVTRRRVSIMALCHKKESIHYGAV